MSATCALAMNGRLDGLQTGIRQVSRLGHRLLAAVLLLGGLLAFGSGARAATPACATEWPLWRSFIEQFVTVDGRVVDHSVPSRHSTSEGQSYGMFLALVANDKVQFDRFWQWSVNNLFGGDVAARLPAWQWGHRSDGSWGVLDANSASDADLFFAHALFEAARLWNEPSYRVQAKWLLDRVVAEEVVELPGVGAMLLPGPQGFVLDGKVWRLNPSYFFVSQLRSLARNHSGPWNEIAGNAVSMLETIAPRGVVADWVGYEGHGEEAGLYILDPVTGDVGSYDAIRVYLWAAITAAQDPLAKRLMAAVPGLMRDTMRTGWPPEKVHATSGLVEGRGPVGFAAAIAPYMKRSGESMYAAALSKSAVDALLVRTSPQAEPVRYYDIVLALFASGWLEGRYHFGADGTLHTDWKSACRSDETP